MVKNERRYGPLKDGDEALVRLFAGGDARHVPERLSDDGPDRLVLYREIGGLRHYLAGEPVHKGAWVAARYEWTFREADPPVLLLEDDQAIPRTTPRPDAAGRARDAQSETPVKPHNSMAL